MSMEKYGDRNCPNCGGHNVSCTTYENSAGTVFNMTCQDCKAAWVETTPITSTNRGTTTGGDGVYSDTER